MHVLIKNDTNAISMNVNSSKLPLYLKIVVVMYYTHL